MALEDIKIRKFLVESNSINFEDLELKNDHLIQGDYHTGNLFFDNYNHVSSVFDFEKARYAPRVFELVRSLIHIFFHNDYLLINNFIILITKPLLWIWIRRTRIVSTWLTLISNSPKENKNYNYKYYIGS